MPRGSKNHKSIAKRFKVTKNKKVVGMKCGFHHKNLKKGTKRVRRARIGMQVTGKLRKSFLQMLSN